MRLEQNFTIDGRVVQKKEGETFLGHEIYYTEVSEYGDSALTYYLVKNGEVKSILESKAMAEMSQGSGYVDHHEVIFKDGGI